MSELSVSDLADLRRTVQLLMPESWTLQRPVVVSDNQGGQTTTYTTVASGSLATSNGARLAPAGYQANERVIAERLGTTDLWRVTLPQGTDARGNDQIVIGGTRTFQIVGIAGPHSYDAALPVTCVEVL